MSISISTFAFYISITITITITIIILYYLISLIVGYLLGLQLVMVPCPDLYQSSHSISKVIWIPWNQGFLSINKVDYHNVS